MAKDVRSLFAGIKDASAKVDAEYDGPGHYLERIEKVKVDQNRKGVRFFAVEKTVIHVFDNAGGHPDAHRVGDSTTFMVMQSSEYFKIEVKAFVKSVLEEDLDAKSEDEILDVIQAIVDDSQPLAGTVVEMRNHNRLKKDKKPEDENAFFTKVKFVREVPASELLEVLTDDEKSRFYPGDQLEKMIEAEKKQAA